MNRFGVVLLAVLLPLCAVGKGLRTLSEREVLQMYSTVLRDACRHADQFWTNSSTQPRVGRWGTGRSDQMNEGIRAISGMVLACGTLLKYSDVLRDAERQEYKSKTMAALRYAVSTHVTGTEKCTDGKSWGASWQSAFWTATMSFGASRIWDDLDAPLRKDIERVLAYEADRFVAIKPPGGAFNDTKAEENGWNLTCISVAATKLPAHPHAAAWNRKAIEYMMNTLSAPQDAKDQTIVDGHAVSEWFCAANVHPDFTLENHGFFHPAYVGCSSYFLTQTAMFYTAAHRAVPQAATHHLLDTWRMFQSILLPNGEVAYPQGMDWELHNISFINLFASLATWQKDPLAARMENITLQHLREWQKMGKGNLAFPGSRLGFTRHCCTIDQISWAFLARKIFRPAVKPLRSDDVVAKLEGVRAYNDIKVITHHTDRKFVSFSWANRVMGMVVPIGAGHEANPDFTVPMRDELIGSFEVSPRGEAGSRVIENSWTKTTNGFETHGVLLLNGGRLKQTISVSSIGSQTVVYQDYVAAESDVTINAELGVAIGIENDDITGNKRSVYSETGKAVFEANKVGAAMPQNNARRELVPMPGKWANVDGRLGVIAVAGSGMAYRQANDYSPGISVRADVLYGSYAARPKHFHKGDEVARRIAIIYTEVAPDETARLGQQVRTTENSTGQVLILKQPNGAVAEVKLLPSRPTSVSSSD